MLAGVGKAAGEATGSVINATGSILSATGDGVVMAASTISTSVSSLWQAPAEAEVQQEEADGDAPSAADTDASTPAVGSRASRMRAAINTKVTNVQRSQALAKHSQSELEARDAREASEAAARFEARLARQQAELRDGAARAPDGTKRVFQCRVGSVVAENVSSEKLDERFFVRFIFGGGAQPAHLRERTRLEWVFGLQPSLRTTTSPAGGLASKCKHRFPDGVDSLRYWLGSYDRLELEELVVELWSCGRPLSVGSLLSGGGSRQRRRLATHVVPLLSLARGSAEQEWLIRTDRGGPPLLRLRLMCFFEELCEFRLSFVQWTGTQLRASDLPSRRAKVTDADAYGNRGSSDPYVVFSIDPPPPAELLGKIIRRGGYFGRSTRTDVVLASLEPSWSEARHPLSFLGTRSELENEVLRLRCYDWDALSPDDLIGSADIPLAGLLDYGTVEARLTIREGEIASHMRQQQSGGERKRDATAQDGGKLLPAGTLRGQLVTSGWTPRYRQIGAPTVRRPGVTYLAVKLIRARCLRPADPNGLSDPFVVVEFGGAQQSSRVVPMTLDPEFEQTLYLPALIGRRGAAESAFAEELQRKGDIRFSVYDHDEGGHDELGFASVPIASVCGSLLAKVEGEEDERGLPYRGRVLQLNELKLTLPGHRIESSLEVWCYFTPDLPPGLQVEGPTSGAATRKQYTTPLDDEYAHRAAAFWKELPRTVTEQLARAHVRELGSNNPIGNASAGESSSGGWMRAFEESVLGSRVPLRLVSGVDEHAVTRVLPELLVPLLPPRAMVRPEQIARMVRCVTWSKDGDEPPHYAGSSGNAHRGESWHSVPWLMDVQRGGFEEHALLMASLLLGLGLDAYVCVGRLRGTREGQRRHAWVLTREDDGSVTSWELSTGIGTPLPGRWAGKGKRRAQQKMVVVPASAASEHSASPPRMPSPAAARSSEEESALPPDLGSPAMPEPSASRRRRQKTKRRRSHRMVSVEGQEMSGVSADKMRDEIESGAADDDANQTTGRVEDDSRSEDTGGGLGLPVLHAKMRQPPRAPTNSMLLPDDVLLEVDWAMDALEASGDEVLDERELMRGLEEVHHLPHHSRRGVSSTGRTVREHEESSPPVSPPASPPDSPRLEHVGASATSSSPPIKLPCDTLEVIFNQRNLWTPRTANLDPARLRFDLEDANAWSALLTNRLVVQGRPRRAHEPRRLPPCPDESRLREIERQIREELVTQITRTRAAHSQQKPRVNRLAKLAEAIEGGLRLFERRACGALDGKKLEEELEAWRRRIEALTPSGSAVRGRPANYMYTDAKRIRAHALSATKYASIRRDASIDFLVGVVCCGFFGGAVSVWVFVGVVDDFSASTAELRRS